MKKFEYKSTIGSIDRDGHTHSQSLCVFARARVCARRCVCGWVSCFVAWGGVAARTTLAEPVRLDSVLLSC